MNLKSILITFLILNSGIIQVYSQRTDQQQLSNSSQLNNSNLQLNSNLKVNADSPDLLNQFNSQSNQNKTFAVDKAVNPEKYIVGPNDLFSLGLYGYINQQIPIVVNVEGSVVIPTVGEINVNGLTLKDVKQKVITAVKKRYYSSDVSFTLTIPKTFFIVVSSLVQKKIEVSSITRTSDVINAIYYDTVNLSKSLYGKNSFKDFFKPDLSFRNIEIVHKDGSITDVDLYKYFITNDDAHNPYFLEGDLLRIPTGLLDKNYITVFGAVQLTGVYEYNNKDDLETIIGLGRGFDQNAEPDSILIYRMNEDTKKFDTYELNYNNDKKFKVNRFDRIFVKFKTNYQKNLSVTIIGEVFRPGIYPISSKNSTLKEIVEMAGGFRESAFLPLSIVFRRYDEEYQKRDTAEIFINMRANDLIINEKDKLSFERDVLSKRNRMVVDFEKLFMYGDSSQNIILEDKDVIYINDDKKSVYVYGQVMNEGFVPFKEGADFEYYIEKAGGYSLAADDGNTRVIKFNSRGWYKPDKIQVLSGDFIYVPKKSPTEFRESLTIIATMIGVVASVITTYLLIKQNQ